MGGGGVVITYSCCSGQTGGRKMPATTVQGVADGYGRLEVYQNDAPLYVAPLFDTRANKIAVGYIFGSGAAGGANGQSGENAGDSHKIAAHDSALYWVNCGAGGGGWGAKGGDLVNTISTAPNYSYGGAGGKAVQTNGYAVTWLGGSDRAYGAVG